MQSRASGAHASEVVKLAAEAFTINVGDLIDIVSIAQPQAHVFCFSGEYTARRFLFLAFKKLKSAYQGNLTNKYIIMKFQFITDEWAKTAPKRWVVDAENVTDACHKMAKLGLLKGHQLRRFDGRWCEIEYAWENTFCDKSAHQEGHCVFMESEDYWSPETMYVFRLENGSYNVVVSDRKGNISKTKGNLLYAWTKAMEFVQWNAIELTKAQVASAWHDDDANAKAIYRRF